MKNYTVITVLVTSFFVVPRIAPAEEASPNPVKHPLVAYDAHQVKRQKKAIRNDEAKLIQTKQSMKERQVFLDQRKAEYEKTLNDNGSQSEVTQQALTRYQNAEEDYARSTQKHVKAHRAMNKDVKKLHHEQAELNKDRQVAVH